ncbi:hypothetical protein ACFOU2_17460 [Bacillus songklensis]|uniref:Uncharacterized protein n=1 Tax=Bacillus songklensis TaxID=1069116 RepID=A0ABV8B6K1_9BACI
MELLTGKPLFGFMGRSETTERLVAAAGQSRKAKKCYKNAGVV